MRRLLECAKKALKFYKDELEQSGGCDHSVGICWCEVIREAEELKEAIAEEQAGKQDNRFQENKERKCGLNNKPVMPRPDIKPKPQKPVTVKDVCDVQGICYPQKPVADKGLINEIETICDTYELSANANVQIIMSILREAISKYRPRESLVELACKKGYAITWMDYDEGNWNIFIEASPHTEQLFQSKTYSESEQKAREFLQGIKDDTSSPYKEAGIPSNIRYREKRKARRDMPVSTDLRRGKNNTKKKLPYWWKRRKK